MKTFEQYQKWLEGFREVVEPPNWWNSIGLSEPIDKTEKKKLLHNCTMIDNARFGINADPQEVTRLLQEYDLVHNHRIDKKESEFYDPTRMCRFTDSYFLPNDLNFHIWHEFNPDGSHWGEGFFVLKDLPDKHLYVLGKHGEITRYRLDKANFTINNGIACNHNSDDDRQILNGRKLLIYLLQRIREENMPAEFHLNSGIFVYNDPKESLERLVI